MEATWRQPQTLKGLSTFLVEHEPCGAGFDVSHPAGLGSGRVSMTCRGCGATYEYATATIEFEREVEFEPIAPRAREAEAAAPAATYVAQTPATEIAAPAAEDLDEGRVVDAPDPTKTAKAPGRKPGKRRQPPKGWTRDRLITGGLLLFSAAALVFAVIRLTGDNGESSNQAPVPTPSVATTPAKPAKPAPATPPAQHSPPAAKAKPAPQPKPQKPAPATRVVKTEHFTVTVPKGWTERAASGGGILLAPPGDTPISLQVFYEDDPSLSAGKMSVQTAGFLSSRDPEAAVSAAKTLRIAGDPAFEVSANGPAGTQTALGVIADPYRYLAIVSADPGTSKSLRATAQRAMLSFKPR